MNRKWNSDSFWFESRAYKNEYITRRREWRGRRQREVAEFFSLSPPISLSLSQFAFTTFETDLQILVSILISFTFNTLLLSIYILIFFFDFDFCTLSHCPHSLHTHTQAHTHTHYAKPCRRKSAHIMCSFILPDLWLQYISSIMLRATRETCVSNFVLTYDFAFPYVQFSFYITTTISTIPFDLISSDYDYDYNSLYLCLILWFL